MAKPQAAENKPKDDFNNLPMVPSFTQTTEDKAKEDLHDVLEMTKELNPNIQDLDTDIESSNETHVKGSIDNSSPQTPNTDVGFDSVFDVEQELPVDLEKICSLCGHSFHTILHSQILSKTRVGHTATL